MDGNRSVGAKFTLQSTLTVLATKDPNFGLSGAVDIGAPVNATCTADDTCVYTLNLTSPLNVTLTGAPGYGSTFNWSQDGNCGVADTCTVTINGEKTAVVVGINFIPQVVLNVLGQGGGGGYVSVAPTGRDCVAVPPPDTNSCVYSFPNGTEVTFTPNPDAGYTSLWKQRCDGWGSSPCIFNAWPGETFTADIEFYAGP